jgi:hypothetical protein
MIKFKSFKKMVMLLALLFAFSCKKDAPVVNAEYIGNWSSINASLNITRDGIATYENISRLIPIRGKVTIEPNYIIIKSSLLKKKLEINRPPYKEDMGAEYGMVTGVIIDKLEVDDEVFTKFK